MSGMGWFLGVSLALLAAGLADAQATVEGQVVDAVTKVPVRKAAVGLYCGGSESYLESDAGGRFAFQTVRVGSCTISASANGYLSGRSDINLADGQKMSGIALRLTPSSAISGCIVDEDGDPLNGFQVQLFYVTYGSGRKQLFPDAKSTTDDRGRYRIPGLSAGKYYLSVSPPGNNDFRLTNQTSRYLPTFYPGIVDPAGAAPVEIPPGSEVEDLNLKLQRVPVVTVRGQVTGVASADGYLIPDSMVAGQQGIRAQNGGNGKFEFRGVPAGDYTLSIRAFAADPSKPAPGGGAPVLTGFMRCPLTVGNSDIEGLTIAIPPPASITARVVIDGEAPRDLSKVVLTVEPVPANANDASRFDAKPAGNGTFRFADLAAGRYRMKTYPSSSGLYLKSVRMGGRELPEPVFDLGGSTEVEVVLSSKTASVAGVVHRPDSDEPAVGTTVVLIPQDKDLEYQRVTTDESGRFTMRDIVPGEYRAFTWEKPDDRTFEYFDPDFVRPIESKGVPVSLGEGASKSVELTAIPPGK
jgi:hypothetical protein